VGDLEFHQLRCLLLLNLLHLRKVLATHACHAHTHKYTHIHKHIQTKRLSHARTQAQAHAHAQDHAHAHTHTHAKHSNKHPTHTNSCLHARTHAHIHTNTHARVHTHAHTAICTHASYLATCVIWCDATQLALCSVGEGVRSVGGDFCGRNASLRIFFCTGRWGAKS